MQCSAEDPVKVTVDQGETLVRSTDTDEHRSGEALDEEEQPGRLSAHVDAGPKLTGLPRASSRPTVAARSRS